ncbi:hypothetical protein V6N13_086372 [Hibiscus sabdariffa]|uniref:Protein kinase domain-containing protein n=1 Tax=Hibiscus sabdariffa TaxID=183260 RepID=A0ABR2FTT9_9ROSI
MKCCFSIFIKDKSKNKNRGSSSVPESRNQSKSQGNSDSRQTSKSFSSSRTIPELYKEKQQNLRIFSLEELKDATNGFNRTLKIGEGGFGSVYKGTIWPLDGRGDPLVVLSRDSTHGVYSRILGHKEWLAEVQFLGVVDHPNLVKLLGYCSADGERGIQRLLVYEFMPNRSLEDHLLNKTSTLPWKTRLEIMLGAAQGLAYLHEGLEVKVIYRDFKSSNVLLDESFRAKLSDFGLAREGPTGDCTHVSTTVVGTDGYAAPEYVDTGHLAIQSDVWTFGVVLYEIITGSAAQNVGKLAQSCLKKNAKERPTMNQVVESLKQAVQESQEGSNGAKKSAVTLSSRTGSRRCN